MSLEDKKDTILNMLSLHPSTDWYQQCLNAQLSSDELELVQNDKQFLTEVQGCLFLEKQKLMSRRNIAIEVAGSRGNWQGYDKLLQEVDTKLFSIQKDIAAPDEDEGTKVQFYLPENGRDSNGTK